MRMHVILMAIVAVSFGVPWWIVALALAVYQIYREVRYGKRGW